MRKILRGLASCVLFGLFGLGALTLAPLMLVLGRTERCQPVVCASWKLLVWLFVHTGLISIDRGNLSQYRGTILVSNHPSLIDVMLLTVLIPRTLSVAKKAAGRNPFMGIEARSVAIPVGADQIERLSEYLAKGWNILIFPEGTRSPFEGTVAPVDGSAPAFHPFRRGAAQLALRTGAPVVCVGIRLSRRILSKRQPAWDMGTSTVAYQFRADRPIAFDRSGGGEVLHAAAVRLTQDLERRVRELVR